MSIGQPFSRYVDYSLLSFMLANAYFCPFWGRFMVWPPKCSWILSRPLNGTSLSETDFSI